MFIFTTWVRDMRLKVVVTHYEPEEPAVLTGHPDGQSPGAAGEFEFDLFDVDTDWPLPLTLDQYETAEVFEAFLEKVEKANEP